MFEWFKQLLRSESAFDELLMPYRVRADQIMVSTNIFLLCVCLLIAPLHQHFTSVFLIGLPTLCVSFYLMKYHRGQLITRLFMGCGFMIYTGLIIHESNGDIEAHFSAFGLIGVLLYYRDWRVIFTATVFIYLHHLIFGYAQSLGVAIYVFDEIHFWQVFLIHIVYFLPFVAMMMYLTVWLRREGYENQYVISVAQRIAQGSLTENISVIGNQNTMPLINSVQLMKSRLLDLLHIMPVAVAIVRVDQDMMVSCNEVWRRMVGYCYCSQPNNKDTSLKFSELPIWMDKHTWLELINFVQDSPEKLLNKTEVFLHTKYDTTILCELSVILHDNIQPVMAIITLEDITLRRKTEQTMYHLAYRDMLTNLPNRVSLQTNLQHAVHLWLNQKIPFAVIMIDLDGFKPINDTYGHDVGDQVLKEIGFILLNSNRETDLVARLGGDEFALVIHHCQSPEQASNIAKRFIDAIATPIHLENNNITVQVGASAGVSHVTDITEIPFDSELMINKADMALYHAKAQGKNQVKLFKQLPANTWIN